MTDTSRNESEPGKTNLTETEASAVRPAEVDVGRIVAHLAEQPGRDVVLAGLPDPTWDDVRASLAPPDERADAAPGETVDAPVPAAFVTPQAFYAEAMGRPDIRRILEALDD